MQWLIDIVFEKVQALLEGTIIIWSGSVVNIPAGWHLCDGTAGTPNLQDKFVIGAGDTYNPADAGGDIDHTHTFTANTHFHELELGAGISAGGNHLTITSAVAPSGESDSMSTPPPYYALAYIMKI